MCVRIQYWKFQIKNILKEMNTTFYIQINL